MPLLGCLVSLGGNPQYGSVCMVQIGLRDMMHSSDENIDCALSPYFTSRYGSFYGETALPDCNGEEAHKRRKVVHATMV